MTAKGAWWRDGVLYQIYPRSFADSNADGVGDLRGVIDHLDYLAWLGVDAIWLNPIYPSPNADWGYDVSDYTGVHEELGSLDDVDELIQKAAGREIRVVFDLVPNHTSNRHPWFEDARSSREARYRDRYVWADPAPNGGPPNNWRSTFSGPAWTLDRTTGQYYLHNFLAEQPDLNWWDTGVRDAFDEILRFWFDRGVAGFRIDVAHAIVKDSLLRDNPMPEEAHHERIRAFGQLQLYNIDRPEVHEVIRRWRRICDSYDEPRALIGETFLFEPARIARYYGAGDGLHLAFNFVAPLGRFEADSLRTAIAAVETTYPSEARPVWTWSNHDIGRFPTRWCEGDDGCVRAALLLLLTLRGTPVLYNGDEVGMTEPVLTRADLRDPAGLRGWPEAPGRDGCRTPMLWSPGDGFGFTAPGAEPWLPFGDGPTVAEGRDDPDSTLHFVRDLIALRRKTRALIDGRLRSLSAPDDVLAFERGEAHAVALNLGEEDQALELSGEVLLGTDRRRDSERFDRLALAPSEGVLIRRS